MARKKPAPPPEPRWTVLYTDGWRGDHANGEYVSSPHPVIEVTKNHVVVEYIPAIVVPGETLTVWVPLADLLGTGMAQAVRGRRKAGRVYYVAPLSETKRNRQEEHDRARQREQEWEARVAEWMAKRQERERQERERQAEAERARREQDEARQRKFEEDMERVREFLRRHGWQGGRFPSGATAAGPEAFAVLGLTPGATLDEVKAKYRELALHHHPDRGGPTNRLWRSRWPTSGSSRR